MSLPCGYGITKKLVYDASHEQKLKALREFAMQGYADEFFEVIGDTVYRISNINGEVKIGADPLTMDKGFIDDWKFGNTQMPYGMWMDVFYDEAGLFVPGFNRSEYVVTAVDGIHNGDAVIGVDSIENGIKHIDSWLENNEEADPGFAAELKRIFEIAQKRKFIWGGVE